MEDFSPWRTVISLKYGTEAGGWFTCAPRGNYGVGRWKVISKEILQLKHDILFELGDGSRIKFWEDVWCGEDPLCESFPSLNALVVSKGAMVAEVWEASRGEGVWNPRFIRAFNDWELEVVQNFIGLINTKKVNPIRKGTAYFRRL